MTAPDRGERSLHQIVFPADDARALPLYVDTSAGEPGSGTPEILDRRRCRVPAGRRVSFAAYFNAFPAGYWQRWTRVREVRLRLHVVGAGTVRLWRSDGDGRERLVRDHAVDGNGVVTLEVPLQGFDDGGWLWFDLAAGAAAVELRSAYWTVPPGDLPPVSATLGITTYNRVDSCLALLRQLGDAPEVLALVDRVYVIDQGEDRVTASARFGDATAGLGHRLTVLEQDNLGGSGGFARCQLETLRAGESDHLVILDDDVVLEPEAVRRAVEFAARCTTPTLVGAQMLSLPEPTRLYAVAESVELRHFRWGPKREDLRHHDLAAQGLRRAPGMHRREDVNYNGWWMCLIPRRALEDVGLSLPFFIRWDDAEYGLRAGAAGFPTVTLPGVAVWHVPWTQKTDALDWQAYYHLRNRLISALLHSPYRRGGLLLVELWLHHVKHLASMQYSTAELRLLALADVLDAGPRRLHASLATKPAQLRAARAPFTDADVRPRAADFPAPARSAAEPSRRTPPVLTAVAGVARQLLPPRTGWRRRPQVRLDAGEAHWTRLLKYDSAVVTTADGAGAVWYRRDRKAFLDGLRRSVVLHQRLRREWPRLAADYREALAEISSPAAWTDTFEAVRRGA